MVQKNEDISESVNSFDTGAIFRPISGHDSRNACVMSGYAFYKKSNWRKGFLQDSEIDKIFEKVLSGEPKLNFSGPAGDVCLECDCFLFRIQSGYFRRFFVDVICRDSKKQN